MSTPTTESATRCWREQWRHYFCSKMQDQGLAPKDLLNRVNGEEDFIDATRVSNWRNGRARASYLNAVRVAGALGVPEEEALAATGYARDGRKLAPPKMAAGGAQNPVEDCCEFARRLDELARRVARIQAAGRRGRSNWRGRPIARRCHRVRPPIRRAGESMERGPSGRDSKPARESASDSASTSDRGFRS